MRHAMHQLHKRIVRILRGHQLHVVRLHLRNLVDAAMSATNPATLIHEISPQQTFLSQRRLSRILNQLSEGGCPCKLNVEVGLTTQNDPSVLTKNEKGAPESASLLLAKV